MMEPCNYLLSAFNTSEQRNISIALFGNDEFTREHYFMLVHDERAPKSSDKRSCRTLYWISKGWSCNLSLLLYNKGQLADSLMKPHEIAKQSVLLLIFCCEGASSCLS